jgi:hemerythrin-like domain-containing protein
MYWEEKELFEIADTMTDDDNWAALLKSYGEADDPIFGSKTERRYQKLFNGLQRRIVWDSQQYFV